MERYTPVIPLSEFIDYLFLDTDPSEDQWVEDFIIPTHPRMILTPSSYHTQSEEQGMVKGIYSRPFQVNTSNIRDMVIGVRFKPYGLYTGFGIDGSEVSNSIVPSTLLIADPLPSFSDDKAEEGRLQLIQQLNDSLYNVLRPKKLLFEIEEMISALVACDLTNDSQKDLARLFERSPKSFIATFKKATGFTPIKYLHIHKVEQAKNVIINNDELSLVEVCHLLGFYDQPHFNRTFKQHTGLTPNQFKRIHPRIER